MDTSITYRKKKDNYVIDMVQYHKSFKYHISHEQFVVPWQMNNEKLEKEKQK